MSKTTTYEKKTQEELKRLIRARDLETFKTTLETIKSADEEVYYIYLYGKNDEGRSFLSWAAMVDASSEFIDYLIDDCKIDVNHQDGKGRTAALLAVDHGCDGNLRKLFHKGADPSIPDNNGDNCMHVVAHSFDKDCAETLLTVGVNIDTANKIGQTPIHQAAFHSPEALKYFFEKRQVEFISAINSVDKDGDTPLHFAAKDETGLSSAFLIRVGADKTMTNKEGETAYEVAEDWESGGKAGAAILSSTPEHPTIAMIHFDEEYAEYMGVDLVGDAAAAAAASSAE